MTTLAALISGIVASKSTQLPRIASQVPDGKKPESRVKRFTRWVGNRGIDAEFQMVAPGHWTELYERLLGDIADGRLPKRRHRSNPRVVKRKISKWRLKRPEHDGRPQPTRPFCEAIGFI